MPEGDTIFRAAQTLHRALAGNVVERFESVLPALTRVDEDTPLAGRTIERVAAAGKHILMYFSGGQILRTHMRMNGSWHVYRPGERWRRSRRDMRVVIATKKFEAVGFSIPIAEFVHTDRIAKHTEIRRLGPDLLADVFDRDEAIRRIRERSGSAVGDVLINQRVLAGIGNVYKSEVLFACGISPFVHVAELDDAKVACLVDTARRFLLANATGQLAPMTTYTGYRRTTGRHNPAERLWVYGRARLGCRKCGTPIRVRAQGTDARLTYWCPVCQRERGRATGDQEVG